MDDISTGLSFEERGIANALTQRVLRVPLNQRSYAWTEDDVQTLLDDLFRAFSAGEKIYFLGTVVLTRGSEPEWQIADGQQRLATTSIIIAAIRDYLLELGDEEGAKISVSISSRLQREEAGLDAKVIFEFRGSRFFLHDHSQSAEGS